MWVEMKNSNNNIEFLPVTKKRASELLYDKVCEMIIQGKLNAKDKLPSERKMMQLFNRSQATVREAMGMLETSGYITINPGEGAYVNEITLHPIIQPLTEFINSQKVSFQEIFMFVKEAEASFATIICTKRDDNDLLQLSTTLDQIHLHTDATPQMHRLIFSFHQQMISSISNPIAVIIWATIYNLLDNRWLSNLDISNVINIHKYLLDAISTRNIDILQQLLEDFWASVLDTPHVKNNVLCSNMEYEPPISDDAVKENAMEPFTVYKISDIIYRQIKERIMKGHLVTGDKLPSERDLTLSFQCSRPSIREALRKLENDGYVTIIQGSGAVVCELSPYPVEKLLENVIRMNLITSDHLTIIRNICDTMAIVWAAENRTAAELKSIKSILDEMEEESDSIERNVTLSREFHARVALASHNQLLCIINQIIWAVYYDRLIAYMYSLDAASIKDALLRRSHDRHYILYESIEKRDPQKAKDNSLAHIKHITTKID